MREMKIVKDVITLIEEMLQSDDSFIVSHAKTLQGPRTRGSTTEFGLEVDRYAPLLPLESDLIQEGCRAFTFTDGGKLKGRVKAVRMVRFSWVVS